MNDDDTINPNSFEQAIENAATFWNGLKVLMDGDAKSRVEGVVPAILRGKPITHEQYAQFQTLVRDIGYDLSKLIRAPRLTPEEEAAAEVKQAELAEKSKAARESYVSPFQRAVDVFLADYIKDNDLDPSVLEGDTKRFRFMYDETERSYRHDSECVDIPVALIEAAAEKDHDPLDYIVDAICNDGPWEHFTDMDTYESETVDSNVTYEADD